MSRSSNPASVNLFPQFSVLAPGLPNGPDLEPTSLCQNFGVCQSWCGAAYSGHLRTRLESATRVFFFPCPPLFPTPTEHTTCNSRFPLPFSTQGGAPAPRNPKEALRSILFFDPLSFPGGSVRYLEEGRDPPRVLPRKIAVLFFFEFPICGKSHETSWRFPCGGCDAGLLDFPPLAALVPIYKSLFRRPTIVTSYSLKFRGAAKTLRLNSQWEFA